MHLMHLALGGCLKAPPIRYGITEDTGGHIAYVMGAARAQIAHPRVGRVEIVTRAFAGPGLHPAHDRPEEPVAPGLRIRRLRTGHPGYLEKDALEAELPALTAAFLDMLAAGPRPDAIHAHFADAAAMALAARDRFGIPVLYTPHSLGLDKGPSVGAGRIARERDALARADAVVCSSRDECERQVEAYGVRAAGRVHNVAPGAPEAPAADGTARARALIDPWLGGSDRPMVLAVARPVAKKNLGGLLHAYAACRPLREAADLVILAGQHGAAAPGSEQAIVIEELRRAVSRRRLKGRVALPPAHDGRDVAELYALAAARRGVFVNVALFEPFGLTTLEAARAGLPVVVTDRGGPPEVAAEIGHGLAVDPGDPDAVGAACLRLVTDRAAWDARAAAARAAAPAYGWDGWAARVVDLCAALAVPRRAAPPRPSAILVSDLDATLTGDAGAAARFGAWHARRRMPFVIATGRSAPEARRVLARWRLPAPDLLIASVGTEIYADGALDEGFAAEISRGWDAVAVAAALRAAGAAMQPPIEQRPWKRSAFGDAAEAARLRGVLARAGLGARVVASHGRLIDVLPPRAGKAAAMRHVARRFGLDARACIACGDSGNDADMLAAAGRAVLVGNALPEVAGLRRPGLYRATARHAGGVLEGLARIEGRAPAWARSVAAEAVR